jgi:hypothetical protein
MNGAARRALSFIPLFGLAVLVFGQFAPVIVVSPAYGVESIKVGIEGVAKSRKVLVSKNVGISHMSANDDDCPRMTLTVIRQVGCYLRERFRLGRTARTDYLALEKITLQRGEMAGAWHHLTSDTRKVYLSDNSWGSPIIVEHVANMFRIFDTLGRCDSDISVSICGCYNNKNEWSLCSVERLLSNIGGLFGCISCFVGDGDRRLHVAGLICPDFFHRFDRLPKPGGLSAKYESLKQQYQRRDSADSERSSIIPSLIISFSCITLGFLLRLFGCERFDDKWKLQSATLIGGGWLLLFSGIYLFLREILRGMPADIF